MKQTIDKIAVVSFLLLVASLPFQKPSLFYFGGFSIAATDVLFPIASFLLLLSFVAGSKSFKLDRVYFFLAAYIAAFVITTIFAADSERSTLKTFATAYVVGLCFLTINFIEDEDVMRLACRVWLFASIVPLAVGLFALGLFYIAPESWLLPHLTYHYGAVPVGNYPRLSSTFVSASMFCNFLNVEILLLLIAKQRSWISNALFWALSASASLCAIFTISSGLGAVLLGIGLWIWCANSKSLSGRLALASGILVCIVSLASSFIALQPHSTAPYSISVPIINAQVYPSPRLMVWSEAVDNFLTSPIVGHGPGTPSASITYENTDGSYSLLTDAHNSFLSVATQTGILGLVAFFALTIYVLRVGCLEWRGDPIRAGVAIAFLTAFVIQGTTSAFEDTRHLWVLMGMLIAVRFSSGKVSAVDI